MDAATAVRRVLDARVEPVPFPHVEVFPALDEHDYAALRRRLPPPAAFDVKGRGLKLELDVAESSGTFMALPDESRQAFAALRDRFRDAIGPALAARFEAPIRAKFSWLFGDAIADEVLAAGLTTTDGRIMGRARGYELGPHLDSAHMAVTCLLYFSGVETVEAGALCLFEPEAAPQVLHASTYYPERDEHIRSNLAKAIPVRENLLVAFVNGPASLHGFTRKGATEDAEWRFVYQCHVVPRGFDIRRVAARLSAEQRARWQRYLAG